MKSDRGILISRCLRGWRMHSRPLSAPSPLFVGLFFFPSSVLVCMRLCGSSTPEHVLLLEYKPETKHERADAFTWTEKQTLCFWRLHSNRYFSGFVRDLKIASWRTCSMPRIGLLLLGFFLFFPHPRLAAHVSNDTAKESFNLGERTSQSPKREEDKCRERCRHSVPVHAYGYFLKMIHPHGKFF